jgi:hypothetical protein
MENNNCQSQVLGQIAIGKAKTLPLSIPRRLKLELRRRLHYLTIRKIQNKIDYVLNFFTPSSEREHIVSPKQVVSSRSPLQAGDLVRVRSREEIQATLNRWKEYRGSGFMDDMWQYCDTVQKVLKPVERFVDERDYQVKKVKGIVLLEGLHCQGTPIFGRCDRNCFYFWREIWLEKIVDEA